MGEFDVIERYFRPLCGEGALSLLDDAAIIPPKPGYDTIITKDLLVEGVHFLPNTKAADIAYRALAVNVSDCIAKGAVPIYYFLGLSIDSSRNKDLWFAGFAAGLKGAQDEFGCQLMGGDTTRSESGVTISITLIGYVPEGAAIKRGGAKVGDDVYVTGTIGDAALGLICQQQQISGYETLVGAFHRPNPPISLGPKLTGIASAAADVSDGLLADASHIAKASAVQIVVHQNLVPILDESMDFLKNHPQSNELLVSGGDDYQMIFTAPKNARELISQLSLNVNHKVTKIGECRAGGGVHLLDFSGKPLPVNTLGYVHF